MRLLANSPSQTALAGLVVAALAALVSACGTDDGGGAPADGVVDDALGGLLDVPGRADTGESVGRSDAVVCTPGEVLGCEEGLALRCDATGVGATMTPCGPGDACQEGACRPIEGTLVLLVDTSGSMNRVVARDVTAGRCDGEGCPLWSFPNCDDAEAPLTRIGGVKKAIRELVTSPSAAHERFVLQRFPTRGHGTTKVTCDSGYSQSTTPFGGGPTLVTGDDGTHETLDDDWFAAGEDEIIAVPATPPGASAPVLQWVDFVEDLEPTGQPCTYDEDCPTHVCLEKVCQVAVNPELRATGATPLGKSLFYAGEYLRHEVLVEGRACGVDEDCGSPHHRCEAGRCHDPLRKCRPNAIILFTDGAESDYRSLDAFFHPRVQAKRLWYGLGCEEAADCAGGATCEAGVCVPPAEALPPEAPTCTVSDLSCETDADCPDACQGSMQTCVGTCEGVAVDYVEGQGHDRVHADSGEALQVRVHVIDASGVPGANRLIAAFGGGLHRSVLATDTLGFLEALVGIVRDSKQTALCIPD
ncbi:MAG: hypothetical protein H6745_29715 [Deltaproteobacteria bacterium]|nr:hypothetical protein [Deltaproteobacteria bacterium]